MSFISASLASTDADEQFGSAVEEVHFQWDERHAFLARLLSELADFSAVGQQAANAGRIMLSRAGRGVLSDMNAVQGQDGRLLNGPDISLGKADLPATNRADFGADQLDAAFQRFPDVVLVSSLAVLDLGFAGFLGFLRSHGRARRLSWRIVNIGCRCGSDKRWPLMGDYTVLVQKGRFI